MPYDCKLLALNKYLLLCNKRIDRQLAAIKLCVMHIDCGYLRIGIGGVVVYPTLAVTAGGVAGDDIFFAVNLDTAHHLLY